MTRPLVFIIRAGPLNLFLHRPNVLAWKEFLAGAGGGMFQGLFFKIVVDASEKYLLVSFLGLALLAL